MQVQDFRPDIVQKSTGGTFLKCIHCDEDAPFPIFSNADSAQKLPFCCLGCLTVYEVIHDKGLSDYYELKKNSAILKPRSPVEKNQITYLYLDDPQFIADYSYTNHDNTERSLEFYLEGIHCLACLWLIEKLPSLVPGIKSSRLDLGKSVVTVTATSEGKFSAVANELSLLGYKPHPLKRDADSHQFKIKAERTFLKRIAIAAAAAGNIMLYAVSLYAGAEGSFARFFGIFTVLFAIPVMTYSAYPFYQSAFNALKNKRMNLDVPISMALILGFFYGTYSTIIYNEENYLDSLTALVFLLLLTRYFLYKIQEKGLFASDLNFFHSIDAVLKKEADGRFTETHVKFLKPDDVIKIKATQMIPVDGIILTGESYLNLALLSGESAPVLHNKGMHVFSGTENLESDLEIQVTKTSEQTRLGKILKGVENGWMNRAPIVAFTDQVSSYFISTVFILASSLFFFQAINGNIAHGFNLFLTLLIVTCPCALALATPMTLTTAISKASRLGIIIKNDEVLQKISQIKNIFLDKTGTLTFGKMKIIHFQSYFGKKDPLYFLNIIASLEKNSKHPVAAPIYEYAQTQGAAPLTDLIAEEIRGFGVRAYYQEKIYEIKALPLDSVESDSTSRAFAKIGFFENQKLCCEFLLADNIRPDSINVIQELRKMNLNIFLISGDKKESVDLLAKKLHIPLNNTFSEVTPEKKQEILNHHPQSMMIGDGANDALALTSAHVGVAVCGAIDISLKASDVYLSSPGTKPIIQLMQISRETMFVIYRNLLLSLSYNLISVFAVFTGHISPLVAAVIMPLSSLTVLFSTLIGTKKLRKIFGANLGGNQWK